MKKRKRIIKDGKRRGEWVESVFLARANEKGIPVSKPWGDSRSYDFVVGRPGRFWAIQVKCTISELRTHAGYLLSVATSDGPYSPGAFDFLAGYVVYEDAWYIIPEKKIRGMSGVSVCTEKNDGRYEEYREAWHLLQDGPKGIRSRDSIQAGAEQLPSRMAEPVSALPRFMRMFGHLICREVGALL
jgi:hypothetical protein